MHWQTMLEFDSEKHTDPVFLYSPDFIDEDFNPTGIVDGFWNDDYGWTIWRWNSCQDCYDTVNFAEPRIFAQKEKILRCP